MKTAVKEKRKLIPTEYPGVFINPELDEEYAGKNLFPEKLALAKERLKKSGFPKLVENK